MIFTFSNFTLPDVVDKMEGEEYETLKRSIVSLMLTQRAEVFRDQMDSEGSPWRPLAPSTLKARLAKVSAKRRGQANAVGMLISDGTLRSSFTDAPGPGKSQLVADTAGDDASIATNVEYAAIQNFGGNILHPGNMNRQQNFKVFDDGRNQFASVKDVKNGEKKGFKLIQQNVEVRPYLISIPARPFDGFSEKNKEEINELIEVFLNG